MDSTDSCFLDTLAKKCPIIVYQLVGRLLNFCLIIAGVNTNGSSGYLWFMLVPVLSMYITMGRTNSASHCVFLPSDLGGGGGGMLVLLGILEGEAAAVATQAIGNNNNTPSMVLATYHYRSDAPITDSHCPLWFPFLVLSSFQSVRHGGDVFVFVG